MICLLLPLSLMAVAAFIAAFHYAYSAHAEAKRLVSDLKSLQKQYDGLLTLCAEERVRRKSQASWNTRWTKLYNEYMVQGVVTPALDRWHKNWIQDHMYDGVVVVWCGDCRVVPEGWPVMYVDKRWK